MSQNITAQIRKTFIDYFQKNGHTIVPGSSLVPKNDPTLMFTNSGMVQFKNYFTGAEKPPFPCAATVQKSVRAGGKHNDLDNVGYTKRHHTFFEMLGNFSFGGYFKEKAIFYAWNLLTKEIGLDKSKLLATVYHTDDEAFDLWKKIAGFSDDRIIRIATKNNFWQMGDTGPCGPCSEIFYDHGEQYWGGKPGTPEEDGDRFIEIWNLVFDQYEDLPNGERINIPKKCIDTGSGLERISAILHGTNDNYEIDIFKSLIENAAGLAHVKPYGEHNTSLRVIADHLRSSSFLLADGVLPSNEGRGYVLRRIMRRAMRHAHLIGCREPLMCRLVPNLIETMGEAYPELEQHRLIITDALRLEEEKFKQTLDKGLKLLADETARLKTGDSLAGNIAFKLYDTYGFPLDLTQDALRLQNMTVDVAGFNTAMEKQREEARRSWIGSGDKADEKVYFQIAGKTGATEFLGYDSDEAEASVLALVQSKETVSSAGPGEEVCVIANQTPFYGEMGGQVGDTGQIKTQTALLEVKDTQHKADGALIVHLCRVVSGQIKTGDTGLFSIDSARRFNIRGHHSATHLLQAALQKVLGQQTHQKGSLVTPDGFRFDFACNKAMTAEELTRTEQLVNNMILTNVPVITELMTPKDAVAHGAMALFDEKYGETVRVVSMGTDKNRYSCELCGGTHVKNTGNIGLFRIVSESGVSAGVRRIEAVAGHSALLLMRRQSEFMHTVMNTLKSTGEKETLCKIAALQEDKKRLEKEIAQLRRQAAMGGAGAGQSKETNIEKINNVSFVGKILHGTPAKELKPLADDFKKKIKSGIITLIAVDSRKVSIVVGVTPDLTDRYNAVELIRAAAEAVGGKGGGGRCDMAQTGGPLTDKTEAALQAVRNRI